MFGSLLEIYIDIIEKFLKKIRISKINVIGVEFSIDKSTGSIDERIKKIETAKQNLIDGLSAIKELETEAENNKKEVKKALLEVEKLRKNKDSLEKEIDSIKQVISSDVSSFKKVAGIPSESQKKRERFLGFISGIIASLLASGIITLIVLIYNNWSQIIKIFII
jgi:chromosome segregation ATPase